MLIDILAAASLLVDRVHCGYWPCTLWGFTLISVASRFNQKACCVSRAVKANIIEDKYDEYYLSSMTCSFPVCLQLISGLVLWLFCITVPGCIWTLLDGPSCDTKHSPKAGSLHTGDDVQHASLWWLFLVPGGEWIQSSEGCTPNHPLAPELTFPLCSGLHGEYSQEWHIFSSSWNLFGGIYPQNYRCIPSCVCWLFVLF